MKKIIGLVFALVLVLSGFPGSVAGADSVNRVGVWFQTTYSYGVPGDSFTNGGAVTGYRNWGSGLGNSEDTGLPVANLTLTLDSNLAFEQIDPVPVMKEAPPEWSYTYEWFFGDVAKGFANQKGAKVGFYEDQIDFIPGFDVFRSANTEFTKSGTQTLRVTATARQALPMLRITVEVHEDENVIPTITSATRVSPINGVAEDIFYLAADRAFISIPNPGEGTPYTYDVTIDVVLQEGISEVEFMPCVGAHWCEPLPGDVAEDVSWVSYVMSEVGEWTWSATGSYTWRWHKDVVRGVGLQGYSREIVAPPTVTSVNPNQGNQGETLDVTITGTNFTGATGVSFGAGITVNSFKVDSPTQITASITIDASASTGPRNVSVTTPGGTGTLPGGFTVNAAPPTISTVSPDSGIQGQTLSNVTITGTYLTGATSVSFGSGITVNSFIVDSSTQITSDTSISSGATPGARDVSVTTPGGTGTLPDAFTVKERGDCFIATAAYGTPMAEEIEVLREFRDKYLLTNPVGQALVDFYYKVSPPMAEFITEHPSLKPIVRVGLLPAVAMSTIAVNTTVAEKAAIVGLLVLVSVALAVWATRRRGRGPEYT